MRRRLLRPRSYSLLSEGGLQITVHAAIMEINSEVTDRNPHNRETLLNAAHATGDLMLFPWLDLGGKQELLTRAQVNCLAKSMTKFNKTMYDFLGKVRGEIDAGAITTPEQIDGADWPS
jgi:hypothetical protein